MEHGESICNGLKERIPLISQWRQGRRNLHVKCLASKLRPTGQCRNVMFAAALRDFRESIESFEQIEESERIA